MQMKLKPDEDRCDFCGGPRPTWMFANPAIRSEMLDVDIPAGHFGACPHCADLVERGKVNDLVAECVLPRFKGRPLRVRCAIAMEFERIYSAISRMREPFVGGVEYLHRAGRKVATA